MERNDWGMDNMFSVAIFLLITCFTAVEAQHCSSADVSLLTAETYEGLSVGCLSCFAAANSAADAEAAQRACYACTPGADGCACTAAEISMFSSEETRGGVSAGCWSCAVGAGEHDRL